MMFFWMMNEADFLRIYETYKGLVYSICYNILQDTDLALEAANDTFVQVDRHYEKLRDPTKEKSWIARIAQNQALSRLRTHINAAKLAEYEIGAIPNPSCIEPETIVIRHETRDEIYRAINEMPQNYRDIFVLAYCYEFQTSEIADMLQLSTDVVYKRLQRGRLKLKAILFGGGREKK